MKRINFFLILLILAGGIWAKKLATFHELNNPYTIEVDRNHIFVTEGVNIYIYSSKDYSFIKKFGRSGEGHGEFKVRPNGNVHTFIHDDSIQVNSIGKVSFFRKDGEFIKEIKVETISNIKPLGDKFVGRQTEQEDNVNYLTINIYDSEMHKIKEVSRNKSIFQGDKGFFAFVTPFVFDTYNNKIYVAASEKFIMNLFDINAKPLFSIKRDYKRLKVKESDKKDLITRYKVDPRFNEKFLDYVKKNIKFPDYYPAIRFFRIDSSCGKIYIKTYEQKGDKYKYFVYDANGKFLKDVYINLPRKRTIAFYPYTFYKDKVYQLFENKDMGTWELHVEEIK